VHSSPELHDSERGADPKLLSYVDRLCEPLQRTLSAADLSEFRLQALVHLEMLAKDLEEDGLSPSDSVERALHEYGRADLLAISYLDEWCKGSRPVGFARGARSATLWSFVWFGLASAICLVATQAVSMLPGMSGFEPIATVLTWVMPVVAGVMTAVSVPTGNIRAVCIALAVVIAHTIIVAQLMQPFPEGSRLMSLQVFAWLPIGCATTYLTALLRRRPRFARRTQGVA